MTNGNYREVGDEYREEEARRRYRLSHPLVEKTKINPLDAVLELSLPFFEANPEAIEFKLTKAELGKIWDLSINPQNRLIAELVSEHPFITDSHKGFLVIERHGIEDYSKIVEQQESQKERIKTINENYPRMMKEIDELETRLQKFMEEKYNPLKAEIEEKTNRVNQQENRLNDLDEQNKKLIDDVKSHSSKLQEAKGKKESLEEENSRIDDELKAIEEENNRKMAGIQIKQGIIKRKKNMSPIEVLNENYDKLKEKYEMLKANLEDRKRIKRIDTTEGLKAGIWFLFRFCFPFVVSYYLLIWLSSYEWYYLLSSIVIFWIIYLWLVFRD